MSQGVFRALRRLGAPLKACAFCDGPLDQGTWMVVRGLDSRPCCSEMCAELVAFGLNIGHPRLGLSDYRVEPPELAHESESTEK